MLAPGAKVVTVGWCVACLERFSGRESTYVGVDFRFNRSLISRDDLGVVLGAEKPSWFLVREAGECDSSLFMEVAARFRRTHPVPSCGSGYRGAAYGGSRIRFATLQNLMFLRLSRFRLRGRHDSTAWW